MAFNVCVASSPGSWEMQGTLDALCLHRANLRPNKPPSLRLQNTRSRQGILFPTQADRSRNKLKDAGNGRTLANGWLDSCA